MDLHLIRTYKADQRFKHGINSVCKETYYLANKSHGSAKKFGLLGILDH